ncbi:hypothetical protein HYW19_03525 [Candidatus Woesearchaeota archaeon]|nr:hypothetical protein [Candidatus Woesearchaeota archaeon]
MAKKRVKKVKTSLGRNKKLLASKKVERKKPAHAPKKQPFLSGFFEKKKPSPAQEYRKKEEDDLRNIQHQISFLGFGAQEKSADRHVPVWFYTTSIFAAFLFTVYLSIFATIHFESIEYMNMTTVFLFISIVSYFLISMVFFVSEKKSIHWIPAFLFFAGVSTIMVYAFKAVDTSNLVRFSIIYTIIVAAISCYVLAIRKGT